ncbi:hypothetical protein [Microbacterium sp. BH-3-3-3]|uniref:hypothetical protein n=1 Tax=Microbacterium sp. BH-3-3-3 TaxID=1906742 RepID=UPI00119F2ED1|nr:hypothetical protein [Microbacterium sp. BH-3-3-3]
MGNLGMYQDITKMIKTLGGPKPALTLIIGGTLAVGSLLTVGCQQSTKAIAKAVKNRHARHDPYPNFGQNFTVHTAGTDEQGLEFRVGDTFSVLECDDDAVLIEIIGNLDNPRFVSGAFLLSISDYPAPPRPNE